MASKALIVLVGHIGSVEELKETANGTTALRFSLAVNTGWGERKTVCWYKCTQFGKRAESVAPYVAKGKNILVTGEPSLNEWTNPEGKKLTSIQVMVDDITLLGSKADDQEAPADGPGDDSDQVPF